MRWVGVVVATSVLAAACTATGGSHVPEAARADPDTARLVAAAALAPCPAATAAPTAALPDVTLACLGAGPPLRPARVRRPALLNLWASWCQPCQREAPALQAVHERAGSRLLVLGVLSDDTRRDGLAAARGFGIRYPSVVDEDGLVRRRFGMVGLPGTLFVDEQGRVVDVVRGELPALAALVARINAHLGVRL